MAITAGDATVSALQNILKTKYDQRKLYQLTYPDCAFLGRIRKDEKFGGNNARITLRYGAPQGGSADFATAQGNKTTSTDAGFLLTRAKEYHIAGITGEALLAAEGDENTLLNGVKAEMEGAMRNFRRSISISLYRNGGGQRGVISASSNVATTTITLATSSDVVMYEVGMWVNLAIDDGTGGAGVETGRVQITAINRDTGALTASANWNTITGAAVGQFIFRQADYGVMVKGLSGWLPAVAPVGGDNWFGVDRSADTTRLAGVRFAAAVGAAKEDTLIDCSARLGREGATPDAVYMNNLDRADIVKGLMGKAVYEMTKSTDGSIGYKALLLEGDKGPLKVYADPNCPQGQFFMLQEDTWVLKSIKGCPHIIDEDGNKMLREAAADGFEWRLRALFQLGCEAPGFNAHGTF